MISTINLQTKASANSNLNKTLDLINSLPDDISRQIYEEYFLAKEKCIHFLNLLETDKSKRLEHKHLVEPTKELLKHCCAIEWLKKKSKVFNICYKHHYVDNHQHFELLDKIDSFCLSILMYLYH